MPAVIFASIDRIHVRTPLKATGAADGAHADCPWCSEPGRLLILFRGNYVECVACKQSGTLFDMTRRLMSQHVPTQRRNVDEMLERRS